MAVQGCSFDNLVDQAGSRYVRAYKGGAVRLEDNAFAAADEAFEVADSGALPPPHRPCGPPWTANVSVGQAPLPLSYMEELRAAVPSCCCWQLLSNFGTHREHACRY